MVSPQVSKTYSIFSKYVSFFPAIMRPDFGSVFEMDVLSFQNSLVVVSVFMKKSFGFNMRVRNLYSPRCVEN